jgi:hypothetical protein
MIIYCVIARGATVLAEGKSSSSSQQQNARAVAHDLLTKLPRDNRSERKTYAADGLVLDFIICTPCASSHSLPLSYICTSTVCVSMY